MRLIKSFFIEIYKLITKFGRAVYLYRTPVLGMIAFCIFSIILTGSTCILRTTTGLPCPGCGLTRATLAILKFDFPLAFHFNPIVFVIWPFAFYLFVKYIMYFSEQNTNTQMSGKGGNPITDNKQNEGKIIDISNFKTSDINKSIINYDENQPEKSFDTTTGIEKQSEKNVFSLSGKESGFIKKYTPHLVVIGVCMILIYIFRMIAFFPFIEPMIYDYNSVLGRIITLIKSF